VSNLCAYQGVSESELCRGIYISQRGARARIHTLPQQLSKAAKPFTPVLRCQSANQLRMGHRAQLTYLWQHHHHQVQKGHDAISLLLQHITPCQQLEPRKQSNEKPSLTHRVYLLSHRLHLDEKPQRHKGIVQSLVG
jgi:hypothetical protein